MGRDDAATGALRLVGASVVLGAVVAVTGLAGGTAQAAPTDTPNWHISAFGYDKLHAQGFTGKGVTIAIAEAGIDLSANDLQGADIEYVPLPEQCVDPQLPKKFINHGTMMAETIVGQGGDGGVQGIAPDAKLIVYQATTNNGPGKDDPECSPTSTDVSGRVFHAAEAGADVISLSFNFLNDTSVAYLTMRDLPVFESGGNQGKAMSSFAPGSVAVGAHDAQRKVPEWSAEGPNVSLIAPGVGLYMRPGGANAPLEKTDGTSFAAPIAAATLALGKQKYPDASGHQLVQSLARNTAAGNADLKRISDHEGYGAIDPIKFMDADPTQYPNEPPFAHKEDYAGADDWQGAEDVLMGMHPNPGDDLKDYKELAGPNPAVLEWVPESKKEFVGAAPEASHWDEHGASASESPSADSSPSSSPSANDQSETESSSFSVWVEDHLVLVCVIVGVVVVLSLGLVFLIKK